MNRDQVVAAGVAAAAFACSAQHIYTVAVACGNPWPIAAVHPAGLDGLVYIGIRAVQNGRRWQGWMATVYGVGMSLTFNAVSYAHAAMPAPVMAVAMPVALVLAVLVVGHGTSADVPRRVKRVPSVSRDSGTRPRANVPVAQPDVPAAQPVSQGVPVTRATGWDRELARKLLAEGDLSRKDIAERVGCSRKSIDRLAS